QGSGGYQDSYFYTNKSDGSMEFWDPENGVTTPNSNYSRSELREMNSSGSAAAWSLSGTHTLSATVKVTQVPDHVCVGQVHSTDSRTTKPLAELYFHSSGEIQLGIENSPSGGQTPHTVGNVPLGQQFSYVIQITGGNTISVTINGSKHSFPIPSSWNGYKQYFKAGDYDQTSGSSSSVGAKVQFYALTVQHS
ncbi:MAG TPA: polysaccharide lyase family 7 protein, partial [Pseudonocardiaceae bacterium]